MALGVMAALAGALSWTLASGLWRRLPTSLGSAELNLLKNLLALVLLLAATLLGTVLGIALQQLALSRLPAGLAVALLSTSPVLAVLLAAAEGDRPGRRGWAAALLVLAGVGLLLL